MSFTFFKLNFSEEFLTFRYPIQTSYCAYFRYVRNRKRVSLKRCMVQWSRVIFKVQI